MAKRGSFTPDDKSLCLKRFKKLKEKCRVSGKDIHLIEKAYAYAYEKHDGVRRKDGTPYIIHCIEVAILLVEMDCSDAAIAAGLLHDTIEDTDVTNRDIAQHFGEEVARIVEAVTNIEPYLPDDCELQKDEIDRLSDERLIKMIVQNCPEALFVKVADRLHNLSTMKCIDNKRRVEKVNDTRDVLIPLVKEVAHAYSLADRLEDACLSAEQPDDYEKIRKKYHAFLKESGRHLERVGAYMVHTLSGDAGSRAFVTDCCFRERSIYSIHNDLIALSEHKEDFIKNFTLRNIPLMDIFFVVKDDCSKEPEQVFLDLYEDIRSGTYEPENKYEKPIDFELTIVAFGRSVNSSLHYLIAADCFDMHYRVFCERASDYKEYLHGLGIQKILERGRTVQVSMGAPMITVYTRKNEKIQIEQGATILDFAFHIHPELAFGAKYAYLNNQKDKIPIYVRLNHGDTVEIVSSTSKDRGPNEPYVEHAEIRWEEWVITKKARKALTRYLEERMGREVPLIMVMDAQTSRNYSLVYNATPFDLAVAVDPVRALCFKEAYLNKSKVPCSFERPLQYQDKVRIVYNDKPCPDFEWLRHVRTDEARNVLIDYFADKIAAPDSMG